MDAIAELRLHRVDRQVQDGAGAKHRKDDRGSRTHCREGAAEEEAHQERSLADRIEPEGERIDAELEHPEDSLADPRKVWDYTAEKDPAGIHLRESEALQDPLAAKVREGVGHRVVTVLSLRPVRAAR